MNKDAFVEQLNRDGFDSIREIDVEANQNREMHTHDTTNRLMVLSGQWALVTEDGVTDYPPGEVCELAAGVLHTERSGPEGARLLLGQKAQ